MKLATYNINSIRSRIDSLLGWMDQHQPDILCLQETKVQDADFPFEPLEAAGYHVAFAGQKSYNGVAILSRNKPNAVIKGFDDGGPADEPRLLLARFGDLTVVNTYVPQGRDITHEMFAYKVAWFGRLRKFLDRHVKPSDPVAWVGDLNVAIQPIDVYNPEKRAKHVCYHQDARDAFARCIDWGFTDLYRTSHPEGGEYTFYDYRTKDSVQKGQGWRIDYILATPSLAERARTSYIDLEPRLAPVSSDHTYLVTEFAD